MNDIALSFVKGQAVFADVRLLRFVDAKHVLLQVRQLGERGVIAEQAREWFFSGVLARV